MAQTQEEVSANLVKFFDKVKERQIKEYPLAELQLIIEMVVLFYKTTKLKVERKQLIGAYTKLIEWYNLEANRLTGLKQAYKKEIV